MTQQVSQLHQTDFILNVCTLCVFVHLQVYLLNPIENLRSYINNRPPLVIFMISVSAVAIAFLTIGYFFKIKEIKSPELTEVSHTHEEREK